jgi:hypothetical protein
MDFQEFSIHYHVIFMALALPSGEFVYLCFFGAPTRCKIRQGLDRQRLCQPSDVVCCFIDFYTLDFISGLEICAQFSIQPCQFVDKWEAYLDSTGNEGPPKVDHFEAIKLDIARKFKKEQDKDVQTNVQRGSRQGDTSVLIEHTIAYHCIADIESMVCSGSKVVFDVASVQDLGNMLNQTNAVTKKQPGKTKVKADAPTLAGASQSFTTPLKRKGVEGSASLLPSSSKPRMLPQKPNSDIASPPVHVRYRFFFCKLIIDSIPIMKF